MYLAFPPAGKLARRRPRPPLSNGFQWGEKGKAYSLMMRALRGREHMTPPCSYHPPFQLPTNAPYLVPSASAVGQAEGGLPRSKTTFPALQPGVPVAMEGNPPVWQFSTRRRETPRRSGPRGLVATYHMQKRNPPSVLGFRI